MNDRFVITIHNFEVSVLDTDNENLLLFGIDCDSVEDAVYLKYELESIVKLLNEQDKIMKEHNLYFP